jgi:serine/threonine protein kinase
MAPEIQGILPPEEEEGNQNYHYTESVDIWALGVAIFYLLFHDYPFSLN